MATAACASNAPRPVAHQVASAPRASPPPAAAPDDDLEGHVEHAGVGGPGLDAGITWHTETGTTHVALEVSLVSPRGTRKLSGDDFSRETGDPLHVEALPLVDRILVAGPQRWIVLGWSSYGEGMEHEHAWLIEDTATGPTIVDSLVWMTDRAHAGFRVDTSTLRVGVPVPPPSDELHNGSDWYLRHGNQHLWLAEVRQLAGTRAIVWFAPAGAAFVIRP